MASADSIADRLTDDGWDVDLDALQALDADLRISDTAALGALLDQRRLQLLESLAHQPASVKQLAEHLGVPPTRLYHHLDLLAEHGAVAVVATRRSGARTERCYAAVRGNVGLDDALLDGHGDEVADAVAKLAEVAGDAAAAAIRSHQGGRPDTGVITYTTPLLTPAQQREFNRELESAMRRVNEASEQNRRDENADAVPTVVLLLAVPDS